MSGLISVGYFLVSLIFGLITFVLWVRMGVHYFRISSLHPIHRVVHHITDPILQPIARLFQIRLRSNQRYDWVCFGTLVFIEWIKFLIIGFLYFGRSSLWVLTLVYTIADLIIQPCDLLFYALLIRVVMSWVNPNWQHPVSSFLYDVTEPLLYQLRRRIPTSISGIDLAPMILMIFLKIITLFVSASLPFHVI